MITVRYSHIEKETEKAYLICFDINKGLYSWFPKTTCQILPTVIKLDTWIAVANLSKSHDYLIQDKNYADIAQEYYLNRF